MIRTHREVTRVALQPTNQRIQASTELPAHCVLVYTSESPIDVMTWVPWIPPRKIIHHLADKTKQIRETIAKNERPRRNFRAMHLASTTPLSNKALCHQSLGNS